MPVLPEAGENSPRHVHDLLVEFDQQLMLRLT